MDQPTETRTPGDHAPASAPGKGMALLALAALGVVFGDIGTSPLYAFKVAVQAGTASGMAAGVAAVGIASLVIWSLIVVVSIKYAVLILRADNQGEGGVVAMLALLGAHDARRGTWKAALLVVGLLGAALLYGDGAITPAISVLSAVEGLKGDAPGLAPMVVPITIAILLGLFLVQSKGTGFIGRVFGPIMAGWFLVIGALGLRAVVGAPGVLAALLPFPALGFLLHAPVAVSFAVFGAVFLAVTGGEAMYADMGHFGRGAIRLAWFGLCLPALVLNYLGQAALIAAHPAHLAHPFYGLAPGWAHYPLVGFATVATVIASQAIISGVFSLTQQVAQLDFLPHIHILHTAREERGQVYVPLANWVLAAATLTAVVEFQSSDALAGAYGIAVSGLMAISTFLAALVALDWGYRLALVVAVNGALMVVDLTFFASNALKILKGGWFPLLITSVVAFLMLTWRRGRDLAEQARASRRMDELEFLATIGNVHRVPGTAAYLTGSRSGIPLSLSTHLKHINALQERVLLISVLIEQRPTIAWSKRATLHPMEAGFVRVLLSFGFMERIDIPAGLRLADTGITPGALRDTSYYIGHETLIPTRNAPGMSAWRVAVFVWMQRNSRPTGAAFGIPSGQLVEIGTEIRL